MHSPTSVAPHTANMVQRNHAIAIIIIVLFVVLGLVGYAIYFINQRIRLAKQQLDDDDI